MLNKLFTLFLGVILYSSLSFSQTVVFEDNFDSYAAGVQLACQNPTDWTTWSCSPCAADDGLISNAQSFSGSNSLVITSNIDQVKEIGEFSSGKYKVSFQAYIPSGAAGYFNTLSDFACDVGGYWAFECYFDAGGAGRLLVDQTINFTWVADAWFLVELIVDLDNDAAELWIDGTMIHQWIWTMGSSSGTGPLVLDANDFFGATADDQMYVDDYTVTDMLVAPAGFSDDFESYTPGTGIACQNPIEWDTWSNAPCGSEDPLVSDAYAYSGSNSILEIQNNDLIRRHGDQTTGKWYISFLFYIPAGASGYFNTMNDFDGSQVWGMDCFFDVGGTGRLDTQGSGGGGNVVNFTWSEAQWNQAMVVVDLDATPPTAEFWTGTSAPLTMVASWDWTNGGTKPAMLAVNDFYGGASTDQMYMDDFYFGDTQPAILPVELTSFAASVSNEGNVILNWTTATEVNNQMFEIERKAENSEFFRIGYVNGHGTTTEAQEYSYVDNSVATGTYSYRLKQIDFNGTYHYSDAVEVEVNGPLTYGLEQNYPNPFNPSTNIKYSILENGLVRLSVYNLIGEEVSVLVNGQVEAGFHEVTFDASSLPSGTYFYRLQAGSTVQLKKMILMK